MSNPGFGLPDLTHSCYLDISIATNNEESRTLVALRDALLPKLISGELRVKDADKIVEAAT